MDFPDPRGSVEGGAFDALDVLLRVNNSKFNWGL